MPSVELLSLSVHASLDLQRTACAVANEGRRFASCDRLSVLVRDESGCRLLAMSGVDVPDARSNVVRRMEQSADHVVRQNLPVWQRESGGDPWPANSTDRDEIETSDEAAPGRREMADALASLQSETGASIVCVVPVGEPTAIGILICEWFPSAPFPERAARAVETVRRFASLALQNAVEYDRLPLRTTLERLRAASAVWRFRRTWIAVGCFVVAIASLILIPVDLTVTARGRLQPVQRRDVFAPSDGIVAELRAHHGQKVDAEQILLTLRNPDLDFEETRIAGELQTAQKRLATVQAARVELQQQPAASRERANQLSGDEEELRELLASLEQQRQIVIRRQADLNVKSPLAGQVVTWDVEQMLATRPVQRGQVLLTVANPNGPWELRLHASENDIGHVIAARRSGQVELPVSFVMSAQPATVFSGRVVNISVATDADMLIGEGVPVIATFDRIGSMPLHPGSAVVANIHCGRRPAGYVLFHRVYEAVRRWGWF